MKTLQELEPMFEQPVLGTLMLALDGYARRGGGPRALRVPCRQLICSLAEEGDRELTRTESQLLSQAVRWHIRRNWGAAELLADFVVPQVAAPKANKELWT